MTTALEQGIGTVTIGVEASNGYTDGKPAYASSVDISAQAALQDRVIKNEKGEDVRTSLTLWVDAGESVYPTNGDRITHDGGTYIVEWQRRVTGIDAVLDHVKAMCRKVGG